MKEEISQQNYLIHCVFTPPPPKKMPLLSSTFERAPWNRDFFSPNH